MGFLKRLRKRIAKLTRLSKRSKPKATPVDRPESAEMDEETRGMFQRIDDSLERESQLTDMAGRQFQSFAEKLRREAFSAKLATDTDSFPEDFREIYNSICPPTRAVRQNCYEEIPEENEAMLKNDCIPLSRKTISLCESPNVDEQEMYQRLNQEESMERFQSDTVSEQFSGIYGFSTSCSSSYLSLDFEESSTDGESSSLTESETDGEYSETHLQTNSSSDSEEEEEEEESSTDGESSSLTESETDGEDSETHLQTNSSSEEEEVYDHFSQEPPTGQDELLGVNVVCDTPVQLGHDMDEGTYQWTLSPDDSEVYPGLYAYQDHEDFFNGEATTAHACVMTSQNQDVFDANENFVFRQFSDSKINSTSCTFGNKSKMDQWGRQNYIMERTGLAFERGNEPDESTLVGIGLAVLQQFPLHLTEDKVPRIRPPQFEPATGPTPFQYSDMGGCWVDEGIDYNDPIDVFVHQQAMNWTAPRYGGPTAAMLQAGRMDRNPPPDFLVEELD